MLEDDQLTPKAKFSRIHLDVIFSIPHKAGASDKRHGIEGPRECQGLKEHEGHEDHEGPRECQSLKDHEDGNIELDCRETISTTARQIDDAEG